MAKKTIYLIRHGETEFNKIGAVQGRGIDADLNEKGQNQASAFFKKYKNVPFKKLYTSSLKRTKQTSKGFIELGIPTESHAGLDEISWGVVEGKTLHEIGYDIFKEIITRWSDGDVNAALEGGESPEEVVERQKEVLDLILSRKDEDLILVTMHGRAIRILLSHILGSPLKEMDKFEHSNTCLYILEYDYLKDTFEIKLSNDTSHISEFMAV
jgi:broad specificity phosphatase PhoE